MTGNFWQSAFLAAVFALHPLRVESVGWITERKDVLSVFFGLSAIIFYVKYAKNSESSSQYSELQKGKSLDVSRKPHYVGYWLLSTVFCILSLMSKPMLVTLPFVLLLLDWWPLGRFGKVRASRLLWEKTFFFVMAVIFSVIGFIAQKNAGAMEMTVVPFDERVANALFSYTSYISKIIVPYNLAVFYPYKVVGLMSWEVIASLVLLIGVSWCVVCRSGRRPYVAVGWFWYIVTLLPVIGIIQIGNQSIADRYTYLPSIGFFVMAVWGMAEIMDRVKLRGTVTVLLSAAVVVGMTAVTRHQLKYWLEDETLFRRAVDVTAGNHVMLYNLGLVVQAKGRLDEAAGHYRMAMGAKPDDAKAYFGFANVLLKRGKAADAIPYYREVLRLDPGLIGAYFNLSVVLAETGRFKEAQDCLDRVLRFAPFDPNVYYNAGVMLHKQGKHAGAKEQYLHALRLDPDYRQAEEALKELEK